MSNVILLRLLNSLQKKDIEMLLHVMYKKRLEFVLNFILQDNSGVKKPAEPFLYYH